jgi:hypothetical protein
MGFTRKALPTQALEDNFMTFNRFNAFGDFLAAEQASQHQHATHELANSLLEAIAKEKKQPLDKIQKKFVRNNVAITVAFWQRFIETPEAKNYNRVEYCLECKKFSLYFEQD